jgi:hypothetical protein
MTAGIPALRLEGFRFVLIRNGGIASAFCLAREEHLQAHAFWRGTGWEYCPTARYSYRDYGESAWWTLRMENACAAFVIDGYGDTVVYLREE